MHNAMENANSTGNYHEDQRLIYISRAPGIVSLSVSVDKIYTKLEGWCDGQWFRNGLAGHCWCTEKSVWISSEEQIHLVRQF